MKYKIIIAGPVGAGKTTAINSLTNENTVMTDVSVSDEVTRLRKAKTTVAMDFGVVKIDDDVAYVYGTPGQQRFNFMWDILSEGAHGLIILLDNTRNYPFRDLKYYADSFADLIKDQQLIIGVTRSDEANEVPLTTYQLWLKELKLKADVKFIDARKQGDVESLVHQLVKQINNVPAQDVASTSGILTEKVTPIVKSMADDKELPLVVEHDTQSVMKHAEEDEDAAKAGGVIEETVVEAVADTSDLLKLDESTLSEVAKLQGVNGVTLTNSIGELLHSTIDDADINEFIAFLSGITPILEDASGMGTIHRIMLRGPKDGNLTVFVEQERSLGVSSDKAVSVPALSQKIEDMLQWV